MRILLIEDDLSVAEYIVKGLRESGYQVEHVADGKSGLVKATTEGANNKHIVMTHISIKLTRGRRIRL